MRKLILLILILLMAASMLMEADVYIKRKLHTDSYYYGGINRPAEDSVDETWIGEKKMVVITRSRIIIIDGEKNRGVLIFKNDKTFAETELPIEMSKLVPENIASYLKSAQYTGTVKEMGEARKIGKFTCQSYEVNSYVMYQGSKANETDSRIWASTDVPFDWKQYSEMYTNLRRLSNLSDNLIKELNKIKGFPIASELYFYPKGFGVKSTGEVIEMTEKNPPTGIYSVPEGYTRKEKLTVQDLRTR